MLHITLQASSQDPARPCPQALLSGLRQLLSAPWAAPCTSLSPKCPLAPQQHPSLTTEQHHCLQTAPAMHKPAGSAASGCSSLPVHFPSSMLNHTPCPCQTCFYSSGKCRQNICLPQPLPISPCSSWLVSLEEHLAPLQWVLLAKLGFTGNLSHAISQGLCFPTKQSVLMG